MGASEFQVSSWQCGTVAGTLASDRLPYKSCELFKLNLWTEWHGLLELAQMCAFCTHKAWAYRTGKWKVVMNLIILFEKLKGHS